MKEWRQDVQSWLASEQQGEEDTAEAAFARVFAALPAVEPGAGFVERAAGAAWQARARHHRLLVLARVAASVALVAGGGLLAYGVAGYASYGGAWAAGTGAVLVSRWCVWLIVSIASGLEWWSSVARVGNGVAAALAMPQGTAALIAVELLGVLALYALQRLLRREQRFHNSGTFCL